MAENNLKFDLPTMLDLHRFGDIYAAGIRGIRSETAAFELIREAKDSIGPHWYGMRCRVTSKKTGVNFYLHTGLIFLPATQIGLMVEVDERNNLAVYDAVVAKLPEGRLYTINRAEKEYFKLFMPEEILTGLNGKSAPEQEKVLGAYMQECGEALVMVMDEQGFSLCREGLLHAYDLGRAFRRVITECADDAFSVQINEKAPDNFGQYASGYRYWLTNKSGTARMYAYFGAIYSYKKRPTGIFAEIDWFSNQQIFDKVKANFVPCDAFEYSSAEEKFIKLFMPQAQTEKLNALDYDAQIEMLKEFFSTCCHALAAAGER